MKQSVIIVAGGSGNRMNAGLPKQFLLLSGKPILMHTIQRFVDANIAMEIIVVLPKDDIETWRALCSECNFLVEHKITEGGETRFHSVKNGLNLISEKSIVAVHDGVRPFVSAALIKKCFAEAEKFGNTVPAISLNESIRKVKGDENEVADRSSFFMIQTPQCFDSEILKAAYMTDYRDSFTDDASVVEHRGEKIHLTEGERENIKITYPIDLLTGESILKQKFST